MNALQSTGRAHRTSRREHRHTYLPRLAHTAIGGEAFRPDSYWMPRRRVAAASLVGSVLVGALLAAIVMLLILEGLAGTGLAAAVAQLAR